MFFKSLIAYQDITSSSDEQLFFISDILPVSRLVHLPKLRLSFVFNINRFAVFEVGSAGTQDRLQSDAGEEREDRLLGAFRRPVDQGQAPAGLDVDELARSLAGVISRTCRHRPEFPLLVVGEVAADERQRLVAVDLP